MSRVLVNDYAGHPFQVELSRWLAERGHQTLHTFCASVQTPRGDLTNRDSDPPNFRVEPIILKRNFNKYGYVTRVWQEIELGRRIRRVIDAFSPDLVLSANTPLVAQKLLLQYCLKKHVPFVYWLQDLLGVAIAGTLSTRFPFLGWVVGGFFKRLESEILSKSSYVVSITDDFMPYISKAGVGNKSATVIENWAPVDNLPVMSKNNGWSKRMGLVEKFCFLYSGTLGLKHNPEILCRLAEVLEDQDSVRIVVVTEGAGAEYLANQKRKRKLRNLLLVDFQPFRELPNIMGTADVLIALLDSGSEYAVPSKVLTYMCAQRPILASISSKNLAARLVKKVDAGVVCTPGDEREFCEAARGLIDSKSDRERMGRNAREYAESKFDITKNGLRFESIFESQLQQCTEERS